MCCEWYCISKKSCPLFNKVSIAIFIFIVKIVQDLLDIHSAARKVKLMLLFSPFI